MVVETITLLDALNTERKTVRPADGLTVALDRVRGSFNIRADLSAPSDSVRVRLNDGEEYTVGPPFLLLRPDQKLTVGVHRFAVFPRPTGSAGSRGFDVTVRTTRPAYATFVLTDGDAVTIDPEEAEILRLTGSGRATVTLAEPTEGGFCELTIEQPDAGDFNPRITNARWAGGAPPQWSRSGHDLVTARKLPWLPGWDCMAALGLG